MASTAYISLVNNVGWDESAELFFVNVDSWGNDSAYPDSVATQTRFRSRDSSTVVSRRIMDDARRELNASQMAGLGPSSRGFLVCGIGHVGNTERDSVMATVLARLDQPSLAIRWRFQWA